MEDENPFSKAQTIDPEVRAYVYSLVNALGGTSTDENGQYVAGDDALAVLRDLKRWLKLYDEKTNRLDVARCLAEAKLVTGDLLPILASWTDEGKNDCIRARMSLACLEVLVPLTWPLEQGEMTVNHHRHTPFLQQAQVIYKAGILNWDSVSILRQSIRVGLPSIAMKRDERTPRDEGIIKLMLYFLRNIAIIRQIPSLPSQGLENEVSRSATVEAFRQQDVFALLLTMCSNMGDDFNQQDVILLEILFNLTKGVDVEKLWMTDQQRRGREISGLKATLNAEQLMHKDARKSEWSRHGRFGTMIWVKREDEKMSTISGQDNLRNGRTALFNIDRSKKWNRPQRKEKGTNHTIYDFDHEEHLTNSATEKLRNFVEEFLDSGFNPLFTHLRKAIEREADRLLDVNYRQFFYVVAWFLRAERVRRQTQRDEVRPTNLTTDFQAESFGLIAAVLNQETFILMNRYMQSSLDNKEWQDLNASMRCFAQILLTVQEMSASPIEEDQEIAENIQNRIFYEESTHDRIISILKGYKDQGFGYLDACTELAHVFHRILERYSKANADLQVRSRRKARRQRKKAQASTAQAARQAEAGDDDHDDADSEDEDIADVVQVSRERKFDFKRFSAKFTSQSSINTFYALAKYFKELSGEQLKRAHRFFHRVAFKQDMAILLYRVDIIALFYRMIEGPDGLSRKHVMYTEWSELTKQLFRRLFKKLDQRPELFIELLFSKISKTLYYLEYGHDKANEKSHKPPADLEVRPTANQSRKEEIGIVVTALKENEQSDLVAFVKTTVSAAFDERHAWEAAHEAGQTDHPTTSAAETVQTLESPETTSTPITVRPSSLEVQSAMIKNARLRLLMRLCGFESSGAEDIASTTWYIPSSISANELAESKEAIEQYERASWQSNEEGETAEDMLRRVRQPSNATADEVEEDARRDAFIDDSEGEDHLDQLDNEEFLFPDNIRSASKGQNLLEALRQKRAQRKRQRRSDDDGDDDEVDGTFADARRKQREQAALERRRKIKSELYIRDSDDETDEERDREFFAQEEINRHRQDKHVRTQMAIARDQAAKTIHRKRPIKRQKRARDDSENDDASTIDPNTVMEDIQSPAQSSHAASSQAVSGNTSEDAMRDSPPRDEDTPLTSPSQHDEGRQTALKELPQPRSLQTREIKQLIATEIELDESSEEENPIRTTVPRRMRGGFVISDDDDDE